jgi:PTS system mannitol-specific IIC component
MVMPNIGAFIAWGLITALFIPTGWIPQKHLAELVSPMITVLLPVLIGTTGGRLVYGQRGAVVGAVATIGIVIGATVPQFLGAMIVGPTSALLIKQFDKYTKHHVPPGFEMLVENFSAGILGALFAVLGFLVIGPTTNWLTTQAGHGVHDLITANLIPLASIIVEPAKVLFLNNAINHGVLAPLGVNDALHHGRSILFMIETNPGPGLGLLLAYWVAGPKQLRPSVPGAIIIQFLGGIHEIYFPYVLMKPRLIVAMILGGAVGVETFKITGAGLVATPSPGSIFAYLAQTPPGAYFGVLLGVVLACATTFLVASMLLRTAKQPEEASEPAADPAAQQPVAVGA